MAHASSVTRLLDGLERFFTRAAPVGAGETIVVAFSGGPDSCALLWGLAELRERQGWDLVAAHLDHGIDGDSRRRAVRAAELARELDVPFVGERTAVTTGSSGLEAAARRARYDFLERVRRRRHASAVATAHHRDDQVETVLLRLRYGSGLRGLRGIRKRCGHVVRPLLDLDRRCLSRVLDHVGLSAVVDPTNHDLALARNRLRHLTRPRLEREIADLDEQVLALRQAAVRATSRLDGGLDALFPELRVDGWPALDLERLHAVPSQLQRLALDLLHRRAGHPYPPRSAVVDELLRQLARRRLEGEDASVRCDGAAGWRWEARRGTLVLLPAPDAVPPFAYTLPVPGRVFIAEVGIEVTVESRPVEGWMLTANSRRAAVDLPVEPGEAVLVRNRRPGDRLRPLGMEGTRRLKDVLIDRKVPRERRERLPLLCVDGAIACAPGVVVDDRFRIRDDTRHAWVVAVGQEF